MMSLPGGWRRTTLGQLGQYWNGRAFKKTEWRESGLPIIRIQNLTGSSPLFNYFDGQPEKRYTAQRGDLLVSWAATLGAYIWDGPEAVVNQHIFKVESSINTRLHKYLLDSKLDELMRKSHGSGMVHVTRSRFDAVPVIIPESDVEQGRLVGLLDDHLSHLDAGARLLSMAGKRTQSFVRAVLEDVVPILPVPGWRNSTVAEAGRLQLGRARHPDWHDGPLVRPYLRVANVFEDRIDTSSVMTMDFSGTFEKYRLMEGDVLLNEGQSPHLLGRPAIYRGIPADVAFTNSLIRFQAASDVLPEWALLVFRRHMHSGRFRRESRITTNIAHLSMTRLKNVEFPIPPLDEQWQRVRKAKELLAGVEYMESESERARVKVDGLRRALLDAAFSGRLTAGVLRRIEFLAKANV